MMRPAALYFFLLTACLILTTSCAGTKDSNTGEASSDSSTLTEKEKAQERNHILQTAEKTLLELYKDTPAAKKMIDKSYGYAVFSNTEI